jgi:hypothetical protein
MNQIWHKMDQIWAILSDVMAHFIPNLGGFLMILE